MQKNFFIIPGFRIQATDEEYSKLTHLLKDRGFTVILVPVHWSRRTLSQNEADFLQFYNQHKSEVNYVLGFSFGAVIAFITAAETRPDKLFLCSLSPYFSENLESWSLNERKFLGKKRYIDLQSRSCKTIAKTLTTDTVLFCGEKESAEFPELLDCADKVVKYAKKAKLVMVPKAPHEIDFPTYQAVIEKELSKLDR